MKRTLSGVLMLLSLLIVFQEEIVIMHFKLNQEFIEKEYCINKENPSLHCHGTCHLREKLKESEQSDFSGIPFYKRVNMLPLSFWEFGIKAPFIEIRETYVFYKKELYIEPYREILEPPPNV